MSSSELPISLPLAVDRLRALAADLDAALSAVVENAACARADVAALCSSDAIGAPDGACILSLSEKLTAAVNAAEARKTVRLEAERVAVDVALEAALCASESNDEGPLLRFVEVFKSTPDVQMEPATITVVPLEKLNEAGVEVVAPAALWAHEVTIPDFPALVRRGPQRLLSIRPLPGHEALSHGPLGQAAASSRLAQLLCVRAVLAPEADCVGLAEGEPDALLLPTTLAPASEFCGVCVFVDVPLEAALSSRLLVAHLSVGGLAVPWQGVAGGIHERCARVCVIAAPLRLPGAATIGYHTPAIAGDGTIYAPVEGSDVVAVFGWDGMRLPPVPIRPLGLYPNRVKVAAVCDCYGESREGVLLLADTQAATSSVVAVRRRDNADHSAPGDVLWRGRGLDSTVGVAVLPAQGMVIVGARYENALHVLSLSDGSRLGSTLAPCRDVVYVAADPSSGLVFASLQDCVVALRWDDDARVLAEADLPLPRPSVAMARNELFPRRSEYRPLTVVAGRPAHLVVGVYNSPDLVVLSLPDCVVALRHRLEGIRVAGLASDPCGSVLAVCDAASKALIVLPWPLPGMELPRPVTDSDDAELGVKCS